MSSTTTQQIHTQPELSHADYSIACICPMAVELAPVMAILDETHPDLPTNRDLSAYTLGRIHQHNVVIAVLPEIGQNLATAVATQLLNDFPSIRFDLLIGIGGGVPGEDGEDDVRLGDIVVSQAINTFGDVVQYDMGKITVDGAFQRIGTLNKLPAILSMNVGRLRARHELKASMVPDILSHISDYTHAGSSTCRNCDQSQLVTREDRPDTEPRIHYGTIRSANLVVKDAATRERLKQDYNLICVEMEAAGLMDIFPCLVIRGICYYADSHRSKKWQPYAAAVAAAYMKELLMMVPPSSVSRITSATDIVPEKTSLSLADDGPRVQQMGSAFSGTNSTGNGQISQVGNMSTGSVEAA